MTLRMIKTRMQVIHGLIMSSTNNQIDRAFISGTLFVTRRSIPAIIRGVKSVTLIS